MKTKKILTGAIAAILLVAAIVFFQSNTSGERIPAQMSCITVHAQMGVVPAGAKVFPNAVLDKINKEGYELTNIITIANDPSLPPYQTNVLFILRKRVP